MPTLRRQPRTVGSGPEPRGCQRVGRGVGGGGGRKIARGMRMGWRPASACEAASEPGSAAGGAIAPRAHLWPGSGGVVVVGAIGGASCPEHEGPAPGRGPRLGPAAARGPRRRPSGHRAASEHRRQSQAERPGWRQLAFASDGAATMSRASTPAVAPARGLAHYVRRQAAWVRVRREESVDRNRGTRRPETPADRHSNYRGLRSRQQEPVSSTPHDVASVGGFPMKRDHFFSNTSGTAPYTRPTASSPGCHRERAAFEPGGRRLGAEAMPRVLPAAGRHCVLL